MGKHNATVMHCISCELSCQISPQKSVRFQYCGNANFILWPERNHFLQKGLQEAHLLYSNALLFNGLIFVDFSVANLHYFINPDWIDRLSETGMKIIIIADRTLAPLANYWIKKWSGILGIIYADDSHSAIKNKFARIFSGRSTKILQGKILSDSEFSLLAFFLSYPDKQKTYKFNEVNAGEIYIRKNRLEKKLGCNINKIFSQISGQVTGGVLLPH
ncbi:RmbA family protein [Trabulsiella guamensis ATCC 49490]|uniref:RmbA family protein n=1 Tax=Trabulsiella guamensis ATCC 49490 TaxID=1005994 RepID=A0A085A2Q8_9ENTR|nr:hypothetical protein [Trabulsiella guamensis]KFC04503.1 RmbA family protein [Trabulsiella guamensis ATCC 49490]